MRYKLTTAISNTELADLLEVQGHPEAARRIRSLDDLPVKNAVLGYQGAVKAMRSFGMPIPSILDTADQYAATIFS